MTNNRAWQQISDDLRVIGDQMRSVHPRETDGPSGPRWTYTYAQKNKLARLKAVYLDLQSAQEAMLRNTMEG